MTVIAMAAGAALGEPVSSGVAPSWRGVFQGVETTELTAAQPRLLRGHAMKIDLRAPGVELLPTPSNGDQPGETDGIKTTAFLEKHRLQAAINAAPFDIIHADEGRPQEVHGLLISCGETVSAAANLPALLVSRDKRAWIADAPVQTAGAWNGVGGFTVVLRAGALTHRGDKKLHPRTAAGVSRDQRFLFLLVIDGRQPGYSLGATTEEVGVWLKGLGSWDGINLDGGGTATMALADSEGKAKLLNRPIHGGLAGSERVSACHLGIKARALLRK
ncbi:MAG: phosphodiester glycosidase family protein [Verrucomicrobiales bacterium]